LVSIGWFMAIGTLLIRADAGTGVGAGHLMRCLALAEAWRERGGSVDMVVPKGLPDGLVARIGEIGARISWAPSEPEEGAWFAATAEARNAAWLVVDGYRFGPAYLEQAARPGRPVLAIDDDARHERYPVTVVLNQNLHASSEDYVGKTGARLLLSPWHALIRSEFRGWRDWRRSIPVRASKVMVTLGGADPGGHTEQVIEASRIARARFPNWNLKARVIVGAANPRLATLRALGDAAEGLEILSDVRDMGEQMRWCDLAISASGSTVWELALFQTPMLVATASRAEEPVATSLRNAGAALHMGRLEGLDIEALIDAVARVVTDEDLRSRLSLAVGAMVDGNGAERVVDQMLAISRDSG
jgi:UDP-2,4-diacetamido-2,4,6-trideoxy-beta-L-altropyranose hydrolase